jgi:hypothetical protein
MTLPTGVAELRKWRRDIKEKNRLRNTMWLKEKGMLHCELCGYDRCSSCLEGHHLNPLEKKDKYDSLGMWITRSFKTFYHKITTHHIQILCRNCHKEIEVGFIRNTEFECAERVLTG